ncbi:amidophosphoribosyltransferase [Bacteroidia bacterium]|nr:amidophosphoribosyltransferase [Bacteroidia bacterium]
MNVINVFKNLISLFYPPLCTGCLDALVGSEQFFCSECFPKLPETHYLSHQDNPAFDRFSGRVPIQKAVAYLYYNKDGLGQKTVAEIKYRGNIQLGQWIGAHLTEDLLQSGFFDDVDFIIPVPLHKKKLRKRGFNQSEVIAQGISGITGIPVEKHTLYRCQANVSQTKKGVYERWKNTQGIFDVKDIELFENKHLLLVDDVLTTGSTLEACAQALLKCRNVKISILTLAIA